MNSYTKNNLLQIAFLLIPLAVLFFTYFSTGEMPTIVGIISVLTIVWFVYSWHRDHKRIKKHEHTIAKLEESKQKYEERFNQQD